MYLSGFTDEAGKDLSTQFRVLKELGWHNMESRAIGDSNLAGITDAQFEELQQMLADAKVKINCYGSTVANWANPITESPDKSFAEMRAALPRMNKLGIKMIRIMSFAVPQKLKPHAMDYYDEVIRRLKIIVKMAEDAGVVCVHENCMNWGGLSYEHTLKLCDALASSPSFRLVFDVGNPVFNDDIRGVPPYHSQSSWDFYRNVKDFIVHIHIKDGKRDNDKMIFTFPGEGDAEVVRIVSDLLKNGYDGGISIEPHMVHVFHETDNGQDKDKLAFENFVEYGRRLENLIVEGTGKRVKDFVR